VVHNWLKIIHFSIEMGMFHRLGTDFSEHKEIVSAVKRVEFTSDKIMYMVL
jgi:hypothetical protein